MLVYKAQQVISCSAIVSNPYEFKDEKNQVKKGTSIFSDCTCIGMDGHVAVIRLKGKTEDEVKKKIAMLSPGKAAEIPIKADEQTRGVAILSA